MKKGIIVTALLLCCFFVGFATIENLNGKWTGTLKTDQGDEYPLLYNFKIDGDQLTGTAKTPKGDMPINDGKITGSTFTFNVIVSGMEIDHCGKFYGDSVGVDISMGDAKSHSTLKRTP
ncbi:MAG: hypothetical protein JWQ84_119 [Mucilaginibacter sp.]|nr:hypothetical protein [Mucilaginibacter sp.]MDB5015287.1 hypothetical protein [Mucilaginibacter sp.]MDB5139530.1 hypothetical protein [Mucilaginibacter sp.]